MPTECYSHTFYTCLLVPERNSAQSHSKQDEVPTNWTGMVVTAGIDANVTKLSRSSSTSYLSVMNFSVEFAQNHLQ